MKKYILTLLTVIILTSCEDNLLDKYPVTTLNPNTFWNTEGDAIAAVNNLYTHLPTIQGWIGREMLSDHAMGSVLGNWTNDVLAGTASSANENFKNWWESAYKGIAATNYFLENVNKVSEIDASLVDRMRGEARFIRAFIYLNLAMDFGGVPLLTETVTVKEGSSVERVERTEVFDFIISELDQISLDLSTRSDYLAIGEQGRITSGAALALQARAALYAGTLAKNFNDQSSANSYLTKAVEAAEKVITSREYGLFPDYNRLFSYDAEYSDEIILSRNYTKDILPSSFFEYGPLELTGSNVPLSVTRDLIDRYEMVTNGLGINESGSGWNATNPYLNRDPRLEATVFLPAYDETSYCSEIFGTRWDIRPGLPSNLAVADVLNGQGNIRTGFAIRKYINEVDAGEDGNDGTNLILIRYADILLMDAEAKIELDQDLNIAVDRINSVRERVGMPTLDNSGYTPGDLADQSILREIVRQERTVELGMEGLRLFDIRRWKIAENVIQGNIEGMSFVDYDTREVIDFSLDLVNREFDPNRDYLYPIPADERSINPSLTQNPGY